MAEKTYRVIQWATGVVGSAALKYFIENPVIDLVGVYVTNPDKVGKDAGDIVGLWLPRSLDLLVMQLGIAKAGAAWLPLDADTPVDRIAVCLDDAQAKGLVSCAAFAPRMAHAPHTVWTAEALGEPVTQPLRALLRWLALMSSPTT